MDGRFKIWRTAFIAIYAIVLCHSFIPHIHTHFGNDQAEKEQNEHQHDDVHHHHHKEVESTSWLTWILDFEHNDLGDGHLEDYFNEEILEVQVLKVRALEVKVFCPDLSHLTKEATEELNYLYVDSENVLFLRDSQSYRGPPAS